MYINLTADQPAAAHSQLEAFLAGLPAGAASCAKKKKYLQIGVALKRNHIFILV